MKKISIKREQSQAGLSFAEREKFRPQVKNKLLLLLALLLTAATGAWADGVTMKEITGSDIQSSWNGNTDPVKATDLPGFKAMTHDEAIALGAPSNNELVFLIYAINASNKFAALIYEYGTKSSDEAEFNLDALKSTAENYWVYYTYSDAPSGYTVTMKDGVKDADKWTVKVGEGQAQALPIGGLKGDGKETVTLQYNGRLKVKGVTATSDAAPAAPSVTEVTTFSELQAALSAGKDVKLMNDIVCTEEISITSGALTIDGNGRLLIAGSEIRAFKVGSSATVAFKNLTLTGFVSGGGPAINNSGTIVLDGCTISNCHVNNSNGGGAIESGGKLYAINTTFSGNYSGEIGGAINNYGGSLYMSGCTFTNNYTTESDAYWGGAIGINGGDEVRLINCSFSGNKYGTGTNTGASDIGVFWKPTNYTIAGCTGATIASNNGDITANASGNATLDYSDLSNIAFTVEQAAKPAATVTTAPTGAEIVGRLNTNNTDLVSGGAADGGTLMYAVTTTNTKPASTDGFSDAVPTAQTITASGKVYVWYYVKADDDTHTDSEIAATAIEVPVADIVWDATNVTDLDVFGNYEPYTKEGVKLSGNAEEVIARWNKNSNPERVGISFETMVSGGFTFTAPSGKKFTKIEMKLQGSAGWDYASLGTGWSYSEEEICKVTWKDSAAASKVDLLKDAGNFVGEKVKYIAFYLVDAE